MCVSVVLAYIHVKIHLDNRDKSHNPGEEPPEAFRGDFQQKSAFQTADFWEKNKSMEGSKSIKFIHTVDQDMIKSIDDGEKII